jgi:LDH2 family malate/lactate/ureidoglycolate dehydrogenase
MTDRHSAAALTAFAAALLGKAGLEPKKADTTAQILVEGDLMGHSTHGLQLLGPYLAELEAGRMAKSGQPTVIAERPAVLTWNGHYLPGPWLVLKAIDAAVMKARTHGTGTVVINHSHHIACLAAYPLRVIEQGMALLLASSDPASGSVAPFGAIAGRYTPNPIAGGWPVDGGEPVIFDISASTTTNGMVGRLNRQGGGARLGGPWLVDNQGKATDDPACFLTEPPGAVLPLGGMDLGHKGFALGLMVEMLTSGLAGSGRAIGSKQWGARVFVQVIDPAAFGGLDAFTTETGWLAEACRTAPVRPGNPPVRMPGERGLQLRRRQQAEGVALHPEIMPGLKPWAEKLGVDLPQTA